MLPACQLAAGRLAVPPWRDGQTTNGHADPMRGLSRPRYRPATAERVTPATRMRLLPRAYRPPPRSVKSLSRRRQGVGPGRASPSTPVRAAVGGSLSHPNARGKGLGGLGAGFTGAQHDRGEEVGRLRVLAP